MKAVPFVLIGLVLLAIPVYLFFKVFNPRPTLRLSVAEIPAAIQHTAQALSRAVEEPDEEEVEERPAAATASAVPPLAPAEPRARHNVEPSQRAQRCQPRKRDQTVAF